MSQDPMNPADDGLRTQLAPRQAEQAQFSARDDGNIRCLRCGTSFPAGTQRSTGGQRVEGASDPADESMVVSVECPNCGAEGSLILRYGPEATTADSAVLSALPRSGSRGSGDGRFGSRDLSRSGPSGLERRDPLVAGAETALDADDIAPAPAVGIVTGAQARGVVAYGAIGLAAGLVLGAIIAVVPMGEWSYLARFALWGGVAAFGGLVAGAVFGGAHEPEREGKVDVALDLPQSSAPVATIPSHETGWGDARRGNRSSGGAQRARRHA